MNGKMNGNGNDVLDELIESELKATEGVKSKKESSEMQDRPAEKKKDATGPVSGRNLKTLSVGEWMLVIFAMIIPVVNIVFMAKWAFSSEGNIHRRNFSRAAMLWLIIILIACVVVLAVTGNPLKNLFSN
ncbi:hypothetical protein Cst_c22620 [Thermoclostridium stercorarium subsp. stercorarium DSM 8532]|uniref:Uncharacterized protein n=3 Tax=Thermoclostridium stercorarium TaxID=1510 RepID=L7VR01_THES1|nr:hypothetical protein [Thermoclostridium stercorarium]AGC69222.1 hypothetical protein Cst_c22620 [Thermoclostridium stercorarium subsp. stercorarium DSM 8532]AGI40193.1 hypothetical protein Clst_2167 [Thermoclostridium stercorarium subsp. stercorarium DSM 8532]ANW99497.1 hypothetical protein CSTERTH_10890 [Thermoclostridium stercorarium subsp. thermolacticum DSM 2910]ANX02123.1 hypothetical protein CSTERLE_11370 [Thermoclostridium stercorarium subsp. leptospartum DSM 9219]